MVSDNRDEEDVRHVRESRAGSQDAFEALYNKHREAAYCVGYRYLHDQDLALDVVQEAFVRAYKSLDSFEGRSSFRTWLCRIAANAAVDMLRSRQRKTTVEFSAAVEDQVREVPGGGASGDMTGLEAAEMTELVNEAIAKLPDHHRDVFVLHVKKGLKYREIAEALGCSIGTVMSRLHHARAKLRKALGPVLGMEAGTDENV